MEHYSLPVDLLAESNKADESIYLVDYRSQAHGHKSKITLNYNLFSFLLEGEKSVHYAGKHAKINDSQFLLLSSGNCLMSEKTAADNGGYRSILLFFDNKVLSDFFLKYPSVLSAGRGDLSEIPFLVFQKDAYLINLIDSLGFMLTSGTNISRDMQRVKLEELLLYLCKKFPSHILALKNTSHEIQEDMEIRQAVTANIDTNITVEELAFLCHMSLSSFKRRFAKLYDTSPNKWLLQKRMEMAADLLKQGDLKASEIYYKVGYENLSSFIQSFKQVYGMTPKQYQIHQ